MVEEEGEAEDDVEMRVVVGIRGEIEMVSIPAVGEELVATGLVVGNISDVVALAIAVSVVAVGSDFVVSVTVVWSFVVVVVLVLVLVVVKESFDSSTNSLS